MGDLYIIDTRCTLTGTIKAAFESSGYSCTVSNGDVTDDALKGAAGFTAICLFVNQKIAPEQVAILKQNGNKLVLHCSAGFDNSPTEELRAAGIAVYRVPSYSPSSIAEFAVSNMLALAKNVELSYVNTKKGDFGIADMQCLLLETRTCAVVGTGLIGKKTCQKMAGLVKKVLCYDVFQDKEWISTIPNAEYVDLDTLLTSSHLITLHAPLMPATRHLLNKQAFDKMMQDVIVVNTSRGELVDTGALLEALKQGKVFGAALDVFEGEKQFIFQDKTAVGFKDDPVLAELAMCENVILSSHIAFYTGQAVDEITAKTLANYRAFVGEDARDEKAVIC
eukprot:GEMP01009689.1.p1 GENE.GEMP01009689.1~~GEMP01009689.1.p1  ORF type:complete len:336 (+),score=89.87 GEMP01009689.1:234-1241(+)